MTLPKTASLRPGRAANRAAAIARQELRRSSAATPIPSGKYKTPRTTIRQSIREEFAR